MKIGFSLGRCIRDIVNKKVDIDDVAYIIAATNIANTESLKIVIEEYCWRIGYLEGLDPEECQKVALCLWEARCILQPRREGLPGPRCAEDSIWVDIFPTVLSETASVKNAWNDYQLVLKLTENVDTTGLNWLSNKRFSKYD
jgi:hypothetical protein